VSQRPSNVRNELGWLLLFVAIFVAITYALLRFVVPLHFNDRVAVIISAILSGVIWIGLRVWRKA
jgi:hypothetical protein